MKIKFILFLLLSVVVYSQKTRLFVMAGQSNMNGFGYNKDLPSALKTFNGIFIFQGKSVADGEPGGGIGKWEVLKPGHGHMFDTDGKANKLSARFGPELSFARKMQQFYPKDKIAIIKYAREGTSIDSLARGDFGSWDPYFFGKNGISQYDHFLTTIKNALADSDIDKDGKKDNLTPSGIIWMQGEGDASYSEEIALKYETHIKVLINLMRAALRDADVPVVIGKISDSGKNETGRVWERGELVQYAQEQFVKNDRNAAIVRETKNYGYGEDPWHYNSAGYINLGERFAEKLYPLLQRKEK